MPTAGFANAGVRALQPAVASVATAYLGKVLYLPVPPYGAAFVPRAMQATQATAHLWLFLRQKR